MGKIFEVKSRDESSNARTAVLKTNHGAIQTPVFMPVGTRGSVKGLTPDQITETGSQIILANTYHMMLRPGADIVAELGGLHKLMAWDKPILTDSGGYQVFSLNTLNKINDNGVEFASHIDGKKYMLGPKDSIGIQNKLGADIIMAFDECTPFPCPEDRLKTAVEKSIRWAEQSLNAHDREEQLLFGIVQGGIDLDLRSRCAEELVSMDFPGYAIGGLSVGEGHKNMIRAVNHTAPLLPENKPRYLMGVGMPPDVIAAVKAGVDMFDCVLPTRNGRNAFAFTQSGAVRLRNSIHTKDKSPIEEGCDCYACRNFSRAAIRHFFNVGEMLGPTLVSIHNIRFFQRLIHSIREKIEEGNFSSWADEQIENYQKCGLCRDF
ncbi:tRNA guanosine(34) transglycosylase Tgt [Sedimentisphaera salicampi]|uniref:Queuine tRNA-ribosyltransferase n=1 Tax=Sedimentisphaera salicampi TaxID=1941349 RepID=A0A1W6LJX2_9BACT|nr:tRNA guanosine(34) transglycosylase Tgt [Sedimentisphaera salicampi]ARN56077.1 Queuine tRNA-ribosyltransferase [Sedimentisphaera salicampi]